MGRLAKLMGVMPPLGKLFFWQPKVWLKIMFGPFTMHQVRCCEASKESDVNNSLVSLSFSTG